jgi:cell division inhibitor SepF
MSIWKKTLLYLGLGPDDEYADATSYPAGAQPVDPGGGQLAAVQQPQPATAAVGVRPIVQPVAQPTVQPTNVRPQPAGDRTVRPRPASARAKPHVVSPHSFNDAQEVADRFKSKQPVIVNLQDVDKDLSRRIIDFSSGMCYGLGGQMERVANHVYLMTPDDVEVSAEDRQRLAEGGFQIV